MSEMITKNHALVAQFGDTLDRLLDGIENLVANSRPTLGGERFLTDKEVSARLKVSRRTLQDYRNNGMIAYYQLGGKIYDTQYAGLMSNIADAGDAGSAIHVDALKAWTETNPNNDIPRMQYGDQYTAGASTRWLTSASYLNFQSFTIGYTLPKKWLSTLGVGKLRVYASGENLCFWSARKGLDPRYSYSENASVNVYSPVRTVMGGLQLTF